MAEPCVIDVASLRPRLEQVFDFAARQVRATIERTPDVFPISTVEGRGRHKGELWTDWCGGFHAGMMWLIARRTENPWWRASAEHYSRLLEHRQHDRDVHDLGFIFLNTYLPWYEMTGDVQLHQVLVMAGRTLALRFMPKGKSLRSFVAPESLFIDLMMNVPLIFYAALTILDTLCSDRYLAWDIPGWEGVLMHGVYQFPKMLGVDESVIWGDFFFLEAVCKVLKGTA